MVTDVKTYNVGGGEFKDISDEEWREYTFGVGIVRIEQPKWLHVKRQTETQHSHRIIDANGISHYIPSGWIALKWKSPTGKEFKFIS